MFGGQTRRARQGISLCRDHSSINPDHHLTGSGDEARPFWRWGRFGIGDLWRARRRSGMAGQLNQGHRT
jgi:hypothetical protein